MHDKDSLPDRQAGTLPSGYGDNKIVLMVRDPWTVYSYWEVSKNVEDGIKHAIREKNQTPVKSVLRVYDITDKKQSSDIHPFFEFELKNWVNNWYVHVGLPGREWLADIGIISSGGEFYRLARSNSVITPQHGVSDICDDEWMKHEELYNKMFAAATMDMVGMGKSSLEAVGMVEQHLHKWLSSGGVTSGMFGSFGLFGRGAR